MNLPKSFVICLMVFILSFAQNSHSKTNDTGGKLLPEQAAYDVTFYELNLILIF